MRVQHLEEQILIKSLASETMQTPLAREVKNMENTVLSSLEESKLAHGDPEIKEQEVQ